MWFISSTFKITNALYTSNHQLNVEEKDPVHNNNKNTRYLRLNPIKYVQFLYK